MAAVARAAALVTMAEAAMAMVGGAARQGRSCSLCTRTTSRRKLSALLYTTTRMIRTAGRRWSEPKYTRTAAAVRAWGWEVEVERGGEGAEEAREEEHAGSCSVGAAECPHTTCKGETCVSHPCVPGYIVGGLRGSSR